MKLLEYEAKQLLADASISIPDSELIKAGDVPKRSLPYVLKSQVPVGGRGKTGGIIVVDATDDVSLPIEKLFKLPIKDFLPNSLLIEEKLTITKEFYLSMLIDRTTSCISLVAHKNGGVEVEENTDFKTWPIAYAGLNAEVIGQELADYYELPTQTFALQDLVENLYSCFVKNDALLIEINPLILTESETLIAGDCKMTLDDAAYFRHDWNFEEKPAETNFVTIDPLGNVATIANGAGLAMATVDAVFEASLKPANFLDIGGGANTETLLKAFNRIVEYENIQAIVINIFAGITRADEVARAIIAAKEQIAHLPPLFIRLAGTNYEAASRLLQEKQVTIMPDLQSCLTAAQGVVHD
ncbi:MAG: sucC [Candidatus Saccharibacteria bacterium]|nr:sucC [Candidatus Saccharibacteria bacterium]